MQPEQSNGHGRHKHTPPNRDIHLQGLLPWSSNYSFLVRIAPNTAVSESIGNRMPPLTEVMAVYKPRRGERPLWDFPQGTLHQRERAAFVVSDALQWHLVPPTVLREGPHGIGSVQLFVQHNPECHYFTIEGNAAFTDQLQKIALLDILINNADRKAGHVLIEESEVPTQPERLWLIDHGICFHTEYKLRTVIWEFAGTAVPTAALADITVFLQTLARKSGSLYDEMSQLLSVREVAALQQRTRMIVDEGTFITPGPGRHYPWPPV
ncbi:MAG: SCO1664 family protein [Anaerolineae bacterium]|nr:SCO1664 family protein [Anaerolineae bacterium]